MVAFSARNIANPRIAGAVAHLSPSLQGKNEALVKILACLFAGGHLLLEDLPGLGKTTLAVAVARLLGLSFGRVQCTNDLLPTDVTGLNIFRMEKGEFEFHPGPIFNNLVLVDEINRATPKTQSALLEAMGEEQVTIDGRTRHLPRPFFVVATQNPVEHSGTFPLPESQMDRFTMKISIGYPDRGAEREILRAGSRRKELENIPSFFSPEEILELQATIEKKIAVSDKILDYLLEITEKTRLHPSMAAGISTRGAMLLLQVAKALAWMNDRDYVLPEDVKAMSEDVLLHRLQLKQGAEDVRRKVLRSIFAETPVFV